MGPYRVQNSRCRKHPFAESIHLYCQTNAPGEQVGHFVDPLQCLRASINVAVDQDVTIPNFFWEYKINQRSGAILKNMFLLNYASIFLLFFQLYARKTLTKQISTSPACPSHLFEIWCYPNLSTFEKAYWLLGLKQLSVLYFDQWTHACVEAYF